MHIHYKIESKHPEKKCAKSQCYQIINSISFRRINRFNFSDQIDFINLKINQFISFGKP